MEDWRLGTREHSFVVPLVPNTQHPTPNTQHPTPNTQHPAPSPQVMKASESYP
ncbi:MAG: hypothetical protein V7L00_09820 [Nostoc sp.]|uniref:hypothetical protein n=1 Tax=Nostoc sp. TaxID=1180 RepID=UPI002FF684B5